MRIQMALACKCKLLYGMPGQLPVEAGGRSGLELGYCYCALTLPRGNSNSSSISAVAESNWQRLSEVS